MISEMHRGTCEELKPNKKCAKENCVKVTSQVLEKMLKCDHCGSTFNQKCNLKRHLKLHSGYKPYNCKDCGLSFYELDSLKKHTRTHTGEKPYHCEVCDASFAHSGHLKAHKRIHSGEKPYVCQECGLSFSQAGNLKVHVRVHTGERPYVCKMCGAAFSISSVFKKHKMVHTGERPFKCTYCDAKFASNSNLSRHNKIHTGEKPFKCLLCSAAFPVKNSLERHVKSHTGERPYCCEMCGAVFADMSDLTKHRKTHTGEKPLKCDVCGMGFFSKSQMKIHIRTHTGEKPHRCVLCGMSFAQTGTLNKHKRTHTGEKPFRCDECGTLFTAKSSLKKHQERHLIKGQPQTNNNDAPHFPEAESQCCPIVNLQAKTVNTALDNKEVLTSTLRPVAASSLTSASLDTNDSPEKTNDHMVNSKCLLPVISISSSVPIPLHSHPSPPLLPGGYSTLISSDVGTSCAVSRSTAVEKFSTSTPPLQASNIALPEPVSVSQQAATPFESRNSQSPMYESVETGNEFHSQEKVSSHVATAPLASTFHYLQSLPTLLTDSCDLTNNM